MYKCVNPMLFCVCISGLLASSKFFELESRMMTKEEIENELLEANATVNISQLILQVKKQKLILGAEVNENLFPLPSIRNRVND